MLQMMRTRRFWRGIGVVGVFILLAATPQQSQAAEETLLQLRTEVINGEMIYPSSFFRRPVAWSQRLQFEQITVPEEWAGKSYYYQLWDAENRPLATFRQPQKLERSQLKNLQELNVENLNTFRFVMFVPKDEVDRPQISDAQTAQISITYSLEQDQRLIGIAAVLGLFLLLLIGATLRTSQQLRHRMSRIIFQPLDISEIDHLPAAIASLWVILLGSSLFGMVVGWFTGGLQIFYVLVKLPFLMLGSLAISFLTIAILSSMVSKRLGFRTIAGLALRVLAILSIVLGSFAVPLYFFITQDFSHNATLLMTLAFAGIAALCGLWTLYRCLSKMVSETLARLLSLGWFIVFGIVGLQLGWLFRPWVGWIDRVSGTVPFMRLYSGNVFEAIFKLIF